MHDIECAVECSEDELEEIFEARRIVREIIKDKKFIPLGGENTPITLVGIEREWSINTGKQPVDNETLVDIRFFDSTDITPKCRASYWDWSIASGNNSADIQFWRHSK